MPHGQIEWNKADESRLLSSQAGVFTGDLRQTHVLLEQYWAINMGEVAMLSSQLVSSYHSRTVSVDGEMCLGSSTISS